MTHTITRKWGLGDKAFENAHSSGEKSRLENEIVKLRAELEELKLSCPHNEEWLRYKHHQFKQELSVAYWTTAECANCGHIIRSKDETYTYHVEEVE